MRFQYTLTVPADTAKASPAEREVTLIKGTLYHVEIAVPPGPNDLVYVVVRDKLFQILPVSTDEAFSWDDYTHQISMEYELTDRGHLLTLVGWSPGTQYSHTIEFRFDVRPARGVSERSLIKELLGPSFLAGR